jgi:ABC-type transport system involved in multi-copper enzyme maturation permease subunit
MVGKVLTIAGNAFRETVRQPIFCIVVAAAGAMLALSPTFTMFTLMDAVKLVKDMGLSTILLAGLLLAVLSASNVVTEEIRGRTALMVVSRAVGRGEFVVGKFLGIALAQLAATYLLTLVLVLTVRVGVPEAVYTKLDTAVAWGELIAAVLTLVVAAAANYFFDKPFPSAVVFAALLFFSLLFLGFAFFDKDLGLAPFMSAMDVETMRACAVLFPMVAVLTAAAVACATRLSLVVSIVACTVFFAVGTLSHYILAQLAAVSHTLAAVPRVLLPNFQVFWLGDALSADKPIPWEYVGTTLGYGALYSAALLFLATYLFEAREIT